MDKWRLAQKRNWNKSLVMSMVSNFKRMLASGTLTESETVLFEEELELLQKVVEKWNSSSAKLGLKPRPRYFDKNGEPVHSKFRNQYLSQGHILHKHVYNPDGSITKSLVVPMNEKYVS